MKVITLTLALTDEQLDLVSKEAAKRSTPSIAPAVTAEQYLAWIVSDRVKHIIDFSTTDVDSNSVSTSAHIADNSEERCDICDSNPVLYKFNYENAHYHMCETCLNQVEADQGVMCNREESEA